MERACSSSSENGYIRPRGTASKNPAVSALQDLLFYQLTGIGFYAKNALEYKKTDSETNKKITRLIYLTNKGINFNINTMMNAINEAYNLKNRVENLYKFVCKNNGKKPKRSPASGLLRPGESLSQMVSQANVINAQKSVKTSNFNIFAIQTIIRQSLSSSANYLEHIKMEEKIPQGFYSQIYNLLDFLGNDNITLNDCNVYALKAGELHTQVLEALISAYEKAYGLIERKKVFAGFKKGNAILVVGDDFPFLKKILEETQEKEINIYTYGTLNYAHSFPEINKYKNLAGVYLGKYDNFAADIESFPGVVVLTSGNIEELTDIFRGRIFSTEDISMLGVTKLERNNLKPLINTAYDAQGFDEDKGNCYVEIGFGIKELENYIDKFYKLIKEEKVKDILVFLGCSDFVQDNNYLKKMIKILPDTTVFITLDCMFSIDINFKPKSINGVPQILNLGQFVNLYTFVRMLFAIAGKFRKDINEANINITINLRGPDTIAALLMLLSLGIKNIKINSELPIYLTDSLINLFNKKYGLSKIFGAKIDAQNIISKKA